MAILLAQDKEIQQLTTRFETQSPQPELVAQLESLLRIAVFKTAKEFVGWLLQQAVDRIDQAYQPMKVSVRQSLIKTPIVRLSDRPFHGPEARKRKTRR